MKLFFKNIFRFSVIPLLFLLLVIVSAYYVSTKIDYKINPNVTDIYIGDSHIECAVNDKLLNNSKNIATSSESFYFSFYKLKKTIEKNKNIKTVYLGFSFHSLSNYYDNFISGKYSNSVSPKYFFTVPVKEKISLIYWNHENLIPYSKNVIKIGYNYLFNKRTFSFGGYSNSFANTTAVKTSMEKRIQFQFYSGNVLNNFSDINLLYLDKIINLCKVNKVNLLIINTPLHSYYQNKIPKNYILKYNETIRKYNLKCINLSGLSFSDSCFIPDGDHLSEKGANQFTKALKLIERM